MSPWAERQKEGGKKNAHTGAHTESASKSSPVHTESQPTKSYEAQPGHLKNKIKSGRVTRPYTTCKSKRGCGTDLAFAFAFELAIVSVSPFFGRPPPPPPPLPPSPPSRPADRSGDAPQSSSSAWSPSGGFPRVSAASAGTVSLSDADPLPAAFFACLRSLDAHDRGRARGAVRGVMQIEIGARWATRECSIGCRGTGW